MSSGWNKHPFLFVAPVDSHSHCSGREGSLELVMLSFSYRSLRNLQRGLAELRRWGRRMMNLTLVWATRRELSQNKQTLGWPRPRADNLQWCPVWFWRCWCSGCSDCPPSVVRWQSCKPQSCPARKEAESRFHRVTDEDDFGHHELLAFFPIELYKDT